MGQAAKKKREQIALASERIIRMARPRFELLSIGSRRSMARYMAEELSFWSNKEESLIGFVFRDVTDDDYGWIAMARDEAGRFRAINVEASLRSEDYASLGLRLWMSDILTQPDEMTILAKQEDLTDLPIDLLAVAPGTPAESLHPYFRILYEEPARMPARAVISEIGPWLSPKDPHLVKEFQQNQFDQRIWELYLWACLREMSFDVEHLEAPDFYCRSPVGEFTVEATTVAPSVTGPLAAHPNPKTHEEMEDFIEEYMPLKFGSSLLSKLNKKNAEGKHYWELEKANGKPFLLAVADFHKAASEEELGSMTYTQASIWQYLYGMRVGWEIIEGKLVLTPRKVETHKFGQKEAPSGFFDQPMAENISAVLFSNAGTIAKFDRMGVVAGYATPGHQYYRIGMRPNPDPNSPVGIPFMEDVASEGYTEMWTDELQVFHNPNAARPLKKSALAGIAQHWFEAGNLFSIVPPHHVLSSFTSIFSIKK